jgi:hypothetical protein
MTMCSEKMRLAATWRVTCVAFLLAAATPAQEVVTTAEARAIAKEAYVYGFPLVDNYRVQHAYFVDRGGKEYKTGWNEIFNSARVYTPDDKAVQTPNSDTPYSFVGADLRAEPLVLTVPAIEKDRYYSLQFVDAYTFNFAYVGSRTTGNEGGVFLLVGPGWKGEKPPGVKDVIRCETELACVIYRTQLFRPDDIENVKKIQAGYEVKTLSRFLGAEKPAGTSVEFMKPLTPEEQRSSVRFFEVLDFALGFCPTHPSERDLRGRFGKLGIGTGAFDAAKLPAPIKAACEAGMADAWKEFEDYKTTQVDTGRRTSADFFGTREFLKGDTLARMAGAVLGIYGNSKAEAIYPAYAVDSEGQKVDGSKNRYALRFGPDALPPVRAFWSLTMYELPASLLYANPLNRYLINSPMLPGLKRDQDGGITLYLQHESPGKDLEPNWLPAPAGPFVAALRLYWPEDAALTGKWKAPPLVRVK